MRILGVGVARELLEEIGSALDDDRVELEGVSAEDALDRLSRHPDGLGALVIGDRDAPIRLAQRAHALAPRVPALLLATPDRHRELSAELLLTPLVSRHLRCVPADSPVEAAHAIRETLRAAEGRRTLRAIAQAANAQLVAAPASSRDRASVLLDRVLDQAPVGIVLLDATGALETINPAALEILAVGGPVTRATVVGRLDERSRAEWDRMVAGAGHRAPTATVVLADVEGSRRIEARASRVGGGRDGAVVVILEDATDRLAALEAVQQHAERLAAALAREKEDARRKDEFLAMLGHELRNPLAPIVTALDLLAKRSVPAVERERAVIDRNVRQIVRLVDDLLDVARITRGAMQVRPSPMDLRTALERAIEMIRPHVERKQQELAIELPADPIPIEGDEARLTQVFSNLLENAARYTPARGHLSLRASATDRGIEVVVGDDGPGIPDELAARIFDPFVQAPQSFAREKGGLGLGLAIVRAIVEQHGGMVELRTGQLRGGGGGGTEAIVRLPRR